MGFEGIIITGTSCAGKSTIAQSLCDLSKNRSANTFEVVKAVTTRSPRPDDFNFEYLDEIQFNILRNQKQLMTADTYRGKYYGIKFEAYRNVRTSGKIPIIVTSSLVSKFLLEQYEGVFMCFFIDAADGVLYNRLKARTAHIISSDETERFHAINKLDRENAYKAHYIIYNNVLTSSISLIELLWEYQNYGGILTNHMIKLNY